MLLVSDDAPLVFYTSGYGIGRNFEPELSALLRANQILLVHRFFPHAVPHDWKYLTIRQAAGDQHRIRESLRNLFPGKWLSTGASKGGMTALFYRRYHPDDVDATVAYVAPLMPYPDDPRFAPFLSQVGTADCRKKIRDFQLLVLSRRNRLLELFRQYNQARNYVFSILSEEAAFEYAVLHVFNVHLGTAMRERRHQSGRLATFVHDRRTRGPKVVLGDFNEWLRGEATRILSATLDGVDLRGYLRRRRTYPGVMPLLHLDHIYVEGGIEVGHVELVRTRTALVASDHVPLVAEIRLGD